MMLGGGSYVTLLISVCVRGIIAASPDPLPGRLFRLDPVEIGFERVLELERGKMFTVKTVSTKPPVFEINNFLSDSECDHIMQLALEEGLDNSTVLEDPRTRFIGSHEGEESDTVAQDVHVDDHINAMFDEFDWNRDGLLDPNEVLDILPPDGNAFMSVNEVHEMFKDLGLDRNTDGYLDLEEYRVTSEANIRDWMYEKMNSDKTRVVRESKQVWLSQNDVDDPVLRSLRKRVISLTKLPRILIEGSELLQVVKYNVDGHYHAHYDSEEIDSDMPCHHSAVEDTNIYDDNFYQHHRLCRYITILYYLNDVEDGGQTAFPLAGNETFDTIKLNDNGGNIYDLSHHCKDAKLRIEPVKGKAVMWYNHHLDASGWVGEMDEFSLHGGCDVRAGTKWIANNWINIDNNRQEQQKYHKFLLEQHQNSWGAWFGFGGENRFTNHDENDATKYADGVESPKNNLDNHKETSTNTYGNDEL